MDKETLPRWGWLLIGLFAMAILANMINVLILGEYGLLSEEYQVITVIAAMAPVLIYIGVWHDDDRQYYWEHSRVRIVGDLVFILAGAAIGSAIALVAVVDVGLPRLAQDMVAMVVGFLLAWGTFWWRNPDLYDVGGS